MALEIERKFRVADLSCTDGRSGLRMRQAYLDGSPALTLRVRIGGDRAWLTIKGPTVGITRSEYEYPIPVADAEAMIHEFATDPVIDKTRYEIDHAGLCWEVDVFHGDNAGLVTAEVELTAENQVVELPPWLGREITDDRRYANSHLAAVPWCEWGDGEYD